MRWRLVIGTMALLLLVASGVAVAASPRKTVPGSGASVIPPPSWRAALIGWPPTRAEIVRLRKKNPAIAAILARPLAIRQLGIRLIAYDPVARGHFHANLNVIVETLPRGVTLRQWMFAGQSSALQYVVKLRSVRAGRVTGVHFASTRVEKFGLTSLLTDEYAFAWQGHVFVFTYTALASQRSDYLPIFTASARTITFRS